VVQAGFGIFQLAMQVGEHFGSPLIEQKGFSSAEAEAYHFYDLQTGRIEVMSLFYASTHEELLYQTGDAAEPAAAGILHHPRGVRVPPPFPPSYY
jgi:hypothetical protein